MKTVFADTSYWVAIANPQDQWHKAAEQAFAALGQVKVMTTETVLVEFLTGLSNLGSDLREYGVKIVQNVFEDANVRVVPQTHDLLMKGLKRYKERPDKKYSMQDCISMIVMEENSIEEVLSSDHHFEQERFAILIK